MKRLIEYFKAARIELGKVAWPNRKTTAKLTALVIVFAIVMAAFLGGLDIVFTAMVQKIIVKG